MNNELWKKIDNHIIETFSATNKQFKKELISSIAINIINANQIIKIVGKKKWLTIIFELFYEIKKIMSYYELDFVSTHNNIIYGIFRTPTKERIQEIFECAVNLNTFKEHFNKRIQDNIIEKKLIIDFGIGLAFSEENYLINSNSKNNNIFFKSKSIDLSIYLSEIANSKENDVILLNDLIFANFTTKYKKENKSVLDFTTYKIENDTFYGCSLINIDYSEWVKKIK